MSGLHKVVSYTKDSKIDRVSLPMSLDDATRIAMADNDRYLRTGIRKVAVVQKY